MGLDLVLNYENMHQVYNFGIVIGILLSFIFVLLFFSIFVLYKYSKLKEQNYIDSLNKEELLKYYTYKNKREDL